MVNLIRSRYITRYIILIVVYYFIERAALYFNPSFKKSHVPGKSNCKLEQSEHHCYSTKKVQFVCTSVQRALPQRALLLLKD